MNRPQRIALSLVIAAGSFAAIPALVSCGDVEERIDCRSVCSRYADCFDSDYDVDGCVDRCSERDEAAEEEVEACQECIDSRSCSESFGCATECAGIVP